jgi:hypothetical protein
MSAVNCWKLTRHSESTRGARPDEHCEASPVGVREA